MHDLSPQGPDRFTHAINGVTTRFGDKRTANMMHRGIMELACAAYAHGGMDAFIQTKKAAAFHEAGHAVVATAFLETVTRVKISRDHLLSQWRWTGLTSYDDQD